MTTAPVVTIDGLVKDYTLSGGRDRLGMSGRGLPAMAAMLRDILGRSASDSTATLRALDGVSFEARPGEVIGILGRNGAGKTTLLKILARVQPPSAGRVTLRGQLVALLELGAAFAPDLTVAETVELFGLTSGIRKPAVAEISDQIIAMAELQDFRDFPLRNCPAGSYVQLCFAALMCLPARIVLADEVLAVGGSAFRQTCEQRIADIASGGGVVLFVSHDLAALRRLCKRIIWLDRGQVRMDGAPQAVIDAYKSDLLASGSEQEDEVPGGCRILDVRLLNAERTQVGVMEITEPGYVGCVFSSDEGGDCKVAFELWRGELRVLSACSPSIAASPGQPVEARVLVPGDLLNDGAYEARFEVWREGSDLTRAKAGTDLRVLNPDPVRSAWGDWKASRPGLVSPRAQWSIEAPAAGSDMKVRT